MAANKFPSLAGKIVLVIVVVAMIGPLFSPAGMYAEAGEAAAVAQPQHYNEAQCNRLADNLWEHCNTWCKIHCHPGGYIKNDQCCCNSGGLAADI